MGCAQFTVEGLTWAAENADEYLVARVALQGYVDTPWPAAQVAAAVRVCNHRARQLTPRQRHRREAKVRRALQQYRPAPEHMAENPNDGYRKASPLGWGARNSTRTETA